MKRFLALAAAFALPLYAALSDAPDFADPVDNTRYQHLIQNIRCPTCQNSNIAESNAPLARQLREQVAPASAKGRVMPTSTTGCKSATATSSTTTRRSKRKPSSSGAGRHWQCLSPSPFGLADVVAVAASPV